MDPHSITPALSPFDTSAVGVGRSAAIDRSMCLLLIHKKRPSCGGPYPNSTFTSATKQVPDLKKNISKVARLLWLLVPLLPWNIVFRIKNSCILQECQCMLPVLASNAHNTCGVDDDVCFDVFFLTSSTNSMMNGQTYFKTKTLPSLHIYHI